MEVIFVYAFAVRPSGHDPDYACAASGTRLDIKVIRADELDLVSRFFTFLQDFFQHDIGIRHLSAK
jgi:hypothetical protein